MSQLREDVAALVRDALMGAAMAPDGRGSMTLPIQALETVVDAARTSVAAKTMPENFDISLDGIATRLKQARSAKFKYAADLARRVSLLPVTVRAHESGQNGYGREVAKKYADALGVSVSWLLYGVEQ